MFINTVCTDIYGKRVRSLSYRKDILKMLNLR